MKEKIEKLEHDLTENTFMLNVNQTSYEDQIKELKSFNKKLQQKLLILTQAIESSNHHENCDLESALENTLKSIETVEDLDDIIQERRIGKPNTDPLDIIDNLFESHEKTSGEYNESVDQETMPVEATNQTEILVQKR